MAYKNKKDPRLKEARRNWYHRNKEKQLLKQKERNNFTREFVKRWKSLQNCADCGLSFKGKPYLCDLHHEEDKKDSVSSMISYGITTIKKEIRKCIPLCANCHRERHSNDLYASEANLVEAPA